MSAIRAVSVIALGLGVFLIVRRVPLVGLIEAFGGWVRGLGIWGPLVYGLIHVAAVLVVAPASVLTMTAGALFGPLIGTIVASLGSTLGAALAFLITRHLARDRVARRFGRYPWFRAIDRAIAEGGWRIVALLRLSMFIPFNMQTYFYGLTRIPFRPYVITTWLAMLPGTVMYVYLGYAGRTVFEVAEEHQTYSLAEWAFVALGIAATIVLSAYATRLVRKALAAERSRDADAEEIPNAPAVREAPWGTSLLAVAAICSLAVAGYLEVRPGAVEGFLRGLRERSRTAETPRTERGTLRPAGETRP